MFRLRTFLLVGVLLFVAGVAQAQQCLHGSTETSDERQRRGDAVAALRTLNTAQMMNRSTAQRFVDFQELVASAAWVRMNQSGKLSSVPGTDLLPGFVLHLTTDGSKYSISLNDKTDPCGFTLYTNDIGVIFAGYPTEYLVIPSK
jgi:hypothetical protein